MKWLTATLAGKKPDIDRVGLSYMLLGGARQGQGAATGKDPSQDKEWFYVGPHVMVVLPDSAKDALRGINQDLSNNQPYISLLSSADVATPIWVIPVAKGGDRIKEEPRYTGEVECGDVVMIKVSVMYANTPGVRFYHRYLIKARLGNACKHYNRGGQGRQLRRTRCPIKSVHIPPLRRKTQRLSSSIIRSGL